MREMKNSGIEWIGDIPGNWKRTKLLNLLRSHICDGPHETPILVDEGIPFISVDSLNSTKNIDLGKCKKFISEEDYLRYKEKANLEEGDILFTKAATIGKTAIVGADIFMVWSPIAIIKANAKITINEYIYHLLSCSHLIKYISLLGSYNTQINVGMRELEQASVPLPPLFEQQKIADYLDHKCAEIDAVIEKTKATIEEYKKLKQSVITEAVTKGVRGDRPMKDSGIEWIGAIPADWDVVRIKNLFDYRNERNFKPLEEVNLISLYTDLGVVQHCDLEETTGNKASNADGYKLVYEDDIVVNIILCWMGAIGRSAYNGVTSPAYDVYSPKEGTNTKFYHHLFRTQGFNGDCYKVGRGIMAMRWRTYADQFRAIKVVSPPPEEQEEIVEYLDCKCAEIDTLIAKKTALLEEMENYKKSVIYEYVTGKKEVM